MPRNTLKFEFLCFHGPRFCLRAVFRKMPELPPCDCPDKKVAGRKENFLKIFASQNSVTLTLKTLFNRSHFHLRNWQLAPLSNSAY
jgi:hypothetical protein